MLQKDYMYEVKSSSCVILDTVVQEEALLALESGKVVYLPKLTFTLTPEERHLLTPSVLHPKHKNVSFKMPHECLDGVYDASVMKPMKALMHRFALFARTLTTQLFPSYADHLRWGRTSYRPVEIAGRVSSKRKDDTRVHVDAFPSTPVQGQRIFRVFCNIHPEDLPRTWLLGENFSALLQRFGNRIPPYHAWRASLMSMMRMTRSFRTRYDHDMLHLHDTMKLDEVYQASLPVYQFDFPAQSIWFVFTDQVSHAALKGQFLLEQTFYLPVEAMDDPALSPLKQWENYYASCKMTALESC